MSTPQETQLLGISESTCSEIESAEPSSMTHEVRINKILSLLRGARMSPADLLLEVLDEYKPQFGSYQTEFYKEQNQKMVRILDTVMANSNGEDKLRKWLLGTGLPLVCNSVSDEMDAIQKVENLPGLASITPDFISNWGISDHSDLAPLTTNILLSAAETLTAHNKNQFKTPDAVRVIFFH